MKKRVQWVQFPLKHAGAMGDDAPYSRVVTGKQDCTVYDGAVVSHVKGATGETWLRIELYREEER